MKTLDSLAAGPKGLRNPIAIIGIGCRFPGGSDSPRAFWKLISEGRDGIVDIPSELAPGRFSQSRVGPIDGAGGGLDRQEACLRAMAEALERYSSSVYEERQFIWATANELGAEAIDLDTLPRCSEQEYAHPRCPIVPPDKEAPLRWVRGVSLMDGRVVWVPAVLVYLNLPFLSAGERICLPISTGCAAHRLRRKCVRYSGHASALR